MKTENTRIRLLLFLAVVGLFVASLSGLSEHLVWLSSLCGRFTGSCRDTVFFTLLGLPVWAWGVGFYAVLAFFILRIRQWLNWPLAGAAGAELSFLYIMVTTKSVCVFCLANFLVVFSLIALSFKNIRSWKMLSLCLMVFILSVFVLMRENSHLISPPIQDRADIVAVASGIEITREDLEAPLTSKIYDLQQDIYRLKKERLDQMLSELVLQKEAEEKGISRQQLIDRVILSGGVDVTDEEVGRYYRQNRNRFGSWQLSDKLVSTRIRSYLKKLKSDQKIKDFSLSLYPKYGVAVYLEEPERLLARVSIDENEAWGPPQAPVTIVEFSDYLCPACRKAHEVVKKIREMYPGKLKWVFKDYPLEMHEGADLAAEAARCAGEQGQFWEFQDVLYESDGKPTLERLKMLADQSGIDGDRFGECLESRKFRDDVQRDMEEAKKAGIDRTPSFLINGRLTLGSPSLEKFKQLIDQELGGSS